MIKQGFSKSKFIIFCIICILLVQSIITGVVYADTIEVTINGTKYSYDTATDTMTVSGGPITEDWKTNDSLKGYVNKLKYVQLKANDNKITSIGNNSFKDCTALEGVHYRMYLTDIGDYAFYGCTNLKWFRWSNQAQTDTLHLSNAIKNIGSHAFEGCTSIQWLRCGESIRSIGDYAFYGCTGLAHDGRGAYATVTVIPNDNNTPDDTSDDTTTETEAFIAKSSSIEFPRKCFKKINGVNVGTVGKDAFKILGNGGDIVEEPIVNVSQSVSWFDKNNGIAEVILNASATDGYATNSAKDYLIIVDTSASMQTSITLKSETEPTNLMEVAKSSMLEFVDEIAEESSSNRVAIVSMGARDDVVTMFWRDCTTDNLNYIKNTISKLDYYSSPNVSERDSRNMGESGKLNDDNVQVLDQDKGIWFSAKRGSNSTRFSNVLISALRLVNIKGTTSPVYTTFFSDGLPWEKPGSTTDINNYMNTRLLSYSSALQSVSAQMHTFFIGLEETNTVRRLGTIMASDSEFTQVIPLTEELQEALDEVMKGIQEWSKIVVKDTDLSEVYNNDYWEIYNANELISDTVNHKVSTQPNGVGDNGVSYTYYLRLKSEKWAMYNENVPVSNYIDMTYNISSDTERKIVQNTTLHTLPWELPYGISYSRGDTNQ